MERTKESPSLLGGGLSVPAITVPQRRRRQSHDAAFAGGANARPTDDNEWVDDAITTYEYHKLYRYSN